MGSIDQNGAGKSTTIETVLGMKKPDRGSVKLLGKDPRKYRKELFEQIGVQLQASNFQNNIKVDEICKEITALYKDPADYHELLRKFHLEAFEKAQVTKLSGGERQKLSVILALIPKPQIVFLDELTTGLDTKARREVWKILKELKVQGTTIFLTTHYMEEAESLCDRICIIKEGTKIIEGSVQDIIKQSPYSNLEEAYLWYMGEEVTL